MPAAAPSTSPARPGTAVTVRIADGQVTPRPGRIAVAAGSRVVLSVTSDVADEVHVHGYELGAPLAPGRPFTIEFVADRTGAFEVETHESHKTLLVLVVR